MKIYLVLSAVALSGCVAANPKTIGATPTPTFAYSNLDCASLAREDAKVVEELGYLFYRQDNRRGADVIGVVAIGLSPSGLGEPDWEPQIAQLKGQREAIGQVMAQKQCPQARAEIDNSTKARIRYRARQKAEAT